MLTTLFRSLDPSGTKARPIPSVFSFREPTNGLLGWAGLRGVSGTELRVPTNSPLGLKTKNKDYRKDPGTDRFKGRTIYSYPGRRETASIWNLGTRKPRSPPMHWLRHVNALMQNSRRRPSDWPSLGPMANLQLGRWTDSSPGTLQTGGAVTARGEVSRGQEEAGQSHV